MDESGDDFIVSFGGLCEVDSEGWSRFRCAELGEDGRKETVKLVVVVGRQEEARQREE